MAEEPLTSSQPSPSPPSSNAAPLGHSVIPIVNKLQDIFAQLGSQSTIELPQVAVVGSQSSGKSSVLEALVGRDFLPRGSDICTRRPLVLQLLQIKRKPDGTEEEYGEFLHLPGKRFYDFGDIRREIQAETEREAGGNKGVTDKQIRLKIFSPNVLDITLVDLPGITKVPVGDQPSDIEARIRTMIMSYIKLPSCLILAVTPANSDLANSDALQIAGNADPDGYRTIGVITKLDIMDRGTDARNFLLGKVIPLRLGYVGVVNRSQEDIMLNRSIKDALVAEEKFFRSRPVYSDLADRCGVPQLAKKLNQAGQGALLLNILSKYSEGKELAANFLNYTVILAVMEVDPCEDLTDDDIRTAIQNATGPKSALFVPEIPFEVLVRRQIARLLDPSLQCARFIYDELIKMSHRCMVNELQRFPVLRKRMDEVVGNFLREGLEPSETMIGHIIEMEMDYINTSHPNFIGGSKAVEMAVKSNRVAPITRPKDSVDPEKVPTSERSLKSRAILARPLNGIVPEQPPTILRPSETHSEQESNEIKITKLLLSSYYDIVRKNIEDSVPKAIMHFLVNHTKREMHNVFIKKLYRDNLFEEMLQEPDEVAMKRKRTRETLRVLQQAFRTLDELPLEADTVERGYSLSNDPTGLPKIHGLPTSSMYSTSSGSYDSYTASPKNPKSRKSSHSGELQSPFYGYSEANGGGRNSVLGLYPTVDM
ncbi:hypothetical protein RHSIM_Rhsim11G0141700 [Rhododendron simsii]|uniref:Dynamin-related protein 3A n=1 Tax=Rhododendron simsii TaxID=118357 RepID=A0A834LAL8_RHOSS|nr:hypothetical protein RHSIM_Rhsim11G0141700 [Rhododendron simsii]